MPAQQSRQSLAALSINTPMEVVDVLVPYILVPYMEAASGTIFPGSIPG